MCQNAWDILGESKIKKKKDPSKSKSMRQKLLPHKLLLYLCHIRNIKCYCILLMENV